MGARVGEAGSGALVALVTGVTGAFVFLVTGVTGVVGVWTGAGAGAGG